MNNKNNSLRNVWRWHGACDKDALVFRKPRRMKNLADQTKQALSEMAAGERVARTGLRERRHPVFPGDARDESALPTSPAVSRKWIALGVGDTLPLHVMAYVIGACRRMRADLLLLCVDAPRAGNLLAEYLPDLSGIECRTEELASNSAAAVVRTLDRQHGVLFAVSGVENDPVHPLLRARRGLRSPVPVVMVTPKPLDGSAAPMQDTRA
jgi:hypothetical protein